MLSEWLSTVLNIAVWSLNYPSQFWNFTKQYSINAAFNDDGSINQITYDFCQAMFLILLTMVIDMIVNWPLSLFKTFMIQESHGFNNQTLGGWFKDAFLGVLLSIILQPILYYGLLYIIYKTGDSFVFWAGLFITVFALIMVVLAPTVIMPLFNKFDPLEQNLMRTDIEQLAQECKYPLSQVEVVDGSKRSGHSNAFQYGIGSIKKIVIFDTLMEQSMGLTEEAKKERKMKKKEGDNDKKTDDKKKLEQKDFNYQNSNGRIQILAVVAHELGHWANYDFLKGISSGLLKIYVIFFAFSYSLKYTKMSIDFGFQDKRPISVNTVSGQQVITEDQNGNTSVFLSLMLFTMILDPTISYLLSVFEVWRIRQIEFAADRYSVEKGYGLALRNSLIALHVNNAANLNPDTLYAMLKFNHPALVERLHAIDLYILQVTKEIKKGKSYSVDNFEELKDAYMDAFKDSIIKRHGKEAYEQQALYIPVKKEESEGESSDNDKSDGDQKVTKKQVNDEDQDAKDSSRVGLQKGQEKQALLQ